jgi:hypothetical protein
MTSSGLKELSRSPAHWYEMRKPPFKAPTPALHFGSAFHAFMLDTHEIIKVEEKISFPKLLEREKELGPKSQTILVSQEDYGHLEAMKAVLMENEIASGLVTQQSAIYELSGFFQDPDFDLIGSIKPDIRIPDLGIIVDLKTAADASEWAFPRSIRRFKYDWQAWWYLRGANQIAHEYYDMFVIIAIEKVPPYGLNIFRIVEDLYYADMHCRPLLETFEICLEADEWPCYSADEVIEL